MEKWVKVTRGFIFSEKRQELTALPLLRVYHPG